MNGSGRERMVQIVPADTSIRIQEARTLLEVYASSLDFDLDFQDFKRELAEFPGAYEEQDGALLLAQSGDKVIGCVALRRLERGTCEMKRLYVIPELRGKGIGWSLALAVIEEARRLGYQRMRLDTVSSMRQAIKLYADLGFKTISAYRHNPIEGAKFMELKLR